MNLPTFLGRLLLAFLLAATAGLAQQPSATPLPRPSAPEESGDNIKINMPGSSVDDVLTLIERWTGKILLRPQTLPNATVSLVIKDPVSKREAVQAVETLLNLNGIALTPLGERFLKVTPLTSVKSEAPEFIEGSTLGLTPSGRTASKLFNLQFLRVSEFMPQITGLLNPAAGSPPVVFDKANAALITDSVSNLQRIETLVSRLDQPALAGLSSKFYQLSNGAKASDVVNKLRTILSGQLQSQLGSSTTFNADDRTNQIILVSDPRQIPLFDDLIAKLDVKSDPNTRNEVISLKHAKAKEVADILSKLVTGQNTAAKTSGQDNVTRTLAAPANGQPTAPAPAAAVPAAIASALAAEASSNQFSSLLTILPDDRTNALVVSGTVDDLRLIGSLVAKIDILLAQVRIEIVIAEVTLSDKATSGIDSLGLRVEDGRLTGIVGATNGASLAGLTTTSTTSPTFATLAGGISGLINISTTPRKGNTAILSVPTITTTHNKEGKIFVGQTRPTITGSTSSNASIGASNPYTSSTISQQEVGITVTVTPLIGTDGSVQLDLKQEISDVGDEVKIDNNVQNVILKRTTSSFITAQSGEILVLGGLQKRTNTKSTNRLGPIPFLGDLLGTRSRGEERTELVFFLRPTVLTNTAADNATALKEVDQFPAKHRDLVKDALGVKAGK